jgi:hypothetical protein
MSTWSAPSAPRYQRLDSVAAADDDDAMDAPAPDRTWPRAPDAAPGPFASASASVGHSRLDDPPRDRAAAFLGSAALPVALTAVDDARVRRRIDCVILPILLWIYFLQYLDKATLSYASVFGLIDDTNLEGQEYSWLGSIVYVAQLVMQPLVAFFLVKFPIGKFTGLVVLGWGVVLCFMAVARDFSGLLATRFFLGAFEASVGTRRVRCRSLALRGLTSASSTRLRRHYPDVVEAS